MPSAAITVSGIPIDPVFAEPKDVRAMRGKHGLAPDQTAILVSAGGFGVGPVESPAGRPGRPCRSWSAARRSRRRALLAPGARRPSQ